MSFKHKPFTGNATDGFEVLISADNAVPTAVGNANVTFAPTTGTRSSRFRRGPEKVAVKARFGGVGAAAADITVELWQWDADVEQWHSTNQIPLVGTTAVGLTAGSIGFVDTDPNCPLGYLRVQGLDGDETVYLTVTKVK